MQFFPLLPYFHHNYFEASHWTWDHMISSQASNWPPPLPLTLNQFQSISIRSTVFNYFKPIPTVCNNLSMFSTFLHHCYYPQPPRYSVSPVCGIFFTLPSSSTSSTSSSWPRNINLDKRACSKLVSATIADKKEFTEIKENIELV